ncbi:hypothetical protein C0992_009891 [Termitomyces sp. T32_za158]|nr:hypothetical protein C0992_009891 [Termitomyces sp. T32_za158]
MANPSPFIPPLPSLMPSPGPAAQQPVIPEPPTQPAANLGWGGRPQHPGAFPTYPSSPYVGPGFQPPVLPNATPNANPGRLPPTLSAEYVGYQGGMQPGMHTPWNAPMQPSPWPGMARPQGPFLQPPNTGGPFPGYQMPYTPQNAAWPYGQFPGGPMPGWGMPTAQAGAPPPMTPMPGGYGFINFDPAWNAPPPGPAWANQPVHPQQNEVPEYLHSRSSARVGDRVDPFMAGSGYGPVLDPFEVQILQHVHSRINPLLEPMADTAPDRPHLKWNMLFRSNDCYLSTDESHVSWSKGRDEPATFPRVTKINIVSETFPWTIPIEASNPAIGVTCGEVIDQLSASLSHLTSKQDFEILDQKRKTVVAQVYRQNRSRDPGVPGGTLGEGIRRLDYLGKDIIFGGIYRDDQVVFKLLGTRPSCHYVLKCLKQYALTAQEAKDHQEKQRQFEEKEREERRKKEEEDRRRAQARRQATVEDDDSDNDDA